MGLIIICGTPRSTDRNRPELLFFFGELHFEVEDGTPTENPMPNA